MLEANNIPYPFEGHIWFFVFFPICRDAVSYRHCCIYIIAYSVYFPLTHTCQKRSKAFCWQTGYLLCMYSICHTEVTIIKCLPCWEHKYIKGKKGLSSSDLFLNLDYLAYSCVIDWITANCEMRSYYASICIGSNSQWDKGDRNTKDKLYSTYESCWV